MRCTWCQEFIIRNLTMKEILLPLTMKEYRCLSCQERLQPIPFEQACPTCRKVGDHKKCQDCLEWQLLFPDYPFSHHAFFAYDEAFQEWIHQYKFLGDYRLRKTFTPEIQAYFKAEKNSLVCAIPLSKERFKERGFNQTEGFLKAAKIPTVQLLKKEVDTDPQARKNRVERLTSEQPFQATKASGLIRGKKIILVDDVYTTGRTLFHAASVIKEYEPMEICTLSLAR